MSFVYKLITGHKLTFTNNCIKDIVLSQRHIKSSGKILYPVFNFVVTHLFLLYTDQLNFTNKYNSDIPLKERMDRCRYQLLSFNFLKKR